MATISPPEENVYLAKLAEQAERYKEMVKFMENVVSSISAPDELTVEERNLLFVAYKNVIGARRASCWIVSVPYKFVPATGNGDSVVFYLKMKGDYHRYLAEFKTGDERKSVAENTLTTYKSAQVCSQTRGRETTMKF